MNTINNPTNNPLQEKAPEETTVPQRFAEIPVPEVGQLDKKGDPINPGSLLQGWCMQMEIDFPEYTFLNPEREQSANPLYLYSCTLKNIERTEGQARNKVEARKSAASLMLMRLGEKYSKGQSADGDTRS